MEFKITLLLFVGGLALLPASWLSWWQQRRRNNRLIRAGCVVTAGGLGLIAALLLVSSGGLYWYYHRPLPDPITDRPLFQGITYSREVRDDPRPVVIHIVKIDLTTPGLTFFVTPRQPLDGYDLPARTTSDFLDEFDLQVAINATLFLPWWSELPWDYYPHDGDPVSPLGLVSSQGCHYGQDVDKYPVLYISQDNRVSFDSPDGAIYNAVAGYVYLLKDGAINEWILKADYKTLIHPRTAVGLDQTGTMLILVVVDGRQPNYSEGMRLYELAQVLLDHGAYTALNLDGGGSSTLVIEGQDRDSEVLNSPIHSRIPGMERPVATHLGVYAPPLP